MIEPKYATFWPRFWAGWIDSLIFLPVFYACRFAFSHSDSIFLRAIVYLIESSAFLVYQIWMHGKYGQTLGKMACRVVVLDVSERRLSMRQAVLRDIFGVILLPVNLITDIPVILQGLDPLQKDQATALTWIVVNFLFAWWVTELITMLTNAKRRALHDFIAGSVVVRMARTALPAVASDPGS